MKPWPKVRLVEVLRRVERSETVDASKEYRLLGIRLEGQGPFLRETVMGTQTSATKLFRVATGDFIYSRLFACRGAFGVIAEELDGCYVSGEFPTFLPVPGKVDVEFLKYWFRLPSVIATVDADCSGSTPLTRNRFKENFFLALEIPLPPLLEQRRVVARIEALAAQIHEARTLRHQAAEEAEALFDTALTARFDSSEWPLKLLPEVAEVARGKFAHRPRNEPRFYGGEYPFIQIGDISNSGRYIRNHSQSLNKDGLAISRMFPAGTIAIAITGATIGVTGILGFDSCFPDSIVGIQAKPQSATPEFIYLAVEHAKKSALAEATQTTQPNINLGNLQRLKVHVPPLAEQRRIVAELDALQAEVDALKRLQAETAAELEALLPALLDRAFKGEL
ncbi:MAG TPA: restriction endonuclease subunit S [Verrucomicrobiae bacterium]|nr:restriction endonuclease subunit S [Verrucomicrobiae bacterium]